MSTELSELHASLEVLTVFSVADGDGNTLLDMYVTLQATSLP